MKLKMMQVPSQEINQAAIDTEVITVLGQRGSGKSSWLKKNVPDIPRFILWDTLGEYIDPSFNQFDNLQELYSFVYDNQGGQFQAVYNSVNDKDFDGVCMIAGAVGDCTLIVEEVDTYATPNYCPSELLVLLKKGRHYGVSMVFVSRRPAEIHRMITAQSQRFILFRILEPNDVRYLKSIVGESADRLPSLPVLSYIDWRHGEITEGKITW